MGKSTIQFFKDLGRRLAVRFQDQRESDFLFQRVSLAILKVLYYQGFYCRALVILGMFPFLQTSWTLALVLVFVIELNV